MNQLNVKYWYFGMIPVFVCSGAAEVLTGMTGPLIGLICGFLMIRIADELTKNIQRWSVSIGGSLAMVFLFLLIPGSSAPIADPFFSSGQIVAQAIIAGVGGIIFYLIFVATLRWWQRKNHPEKS